MLRAEFSLSSITAEEATPERKAPIRVKFEIPYFTVSGIQVRLHKHNYLFYFMISCGEWHDLYTNTVTCSIYSVVNDMTSLSLIWTCQLS